MPGKKIFINAAAKKWNIETNHLVYEKADAGLCGAVSYSATLNGANVPFVRADPTGLGFRDYGDDDEKKRQFNAKTTKDNKDGASKTYKMTVELEDWPIANFPSAFSKTYTNTLVWSKKNKNRAQSLSTIS